MGKPSDTPSSAQPSDELSRRAFLKRAGIIAAAGGGLVAAGYFLHARDPLGAASGEARAGKSFMVADDATRPRTVSVQGGDIVKRVHAAINELGGMGRFVSPGDRVLLKPNMAWDSTPDYAANTNPLVVYEIARLCIDAGAGSVLIAENSVNSHEICAERSGIGEVASKLGIDLFAPGDDDFVEARLGGKAIGTWPIMKALFDADKVINLPTPKHHKLSRVTCALKNWLGIAGGKRSRMHQDIHQSIVDLVAAFPPTLSLADCSRVMLRGGPTGGDLADIKESDLLVAGIDPATLDAAVLPLLGVDHTEVQHITEAMTRGLGTLSLDAVARVML